MSRQAWAIRAGARLLLAGLCLVIGVVAAGPAAAGSHPVVSSVRPATVNTTGGTVTLRGYGFTGTRMVRLLSLPSASVTARPLYVFYQASSDNTLRLSVPAHVAGTVWIEVTTASGSSVYSSHDRLQYSKSAGTAASQPGKDTLGALLLAMLLGMIFSRNKNEQT